MGYKIKIEIRKLNKFHLHNKRNKYVVVVGWSVSICNHEKVISFHKECDRLTFRYFVGWINDGDQYRLNMTFIHIIIILKPKAYTNPSFVVVVVVAVIYIMNGIVHRWWVHVNRVIQFVLGHVKYLATPIGNFLNKLVFIPHPIDMYNFVERENRISMV